MRLLRLSLHNWRGVDLREIRFATGVTLVEGPNEVGKSTIVEALRMLFKEMDSSNKKNVKAIQPIGQDVGSRVEAEVEAGEYHFVYAKTYNKSKQTSLDILAPEQRQLTGREAHEAVEKMLAQSVDMVLWDALLVDQGEKVAPANLQASTGLAQALDEAAGTASGAEDTALFSAVQDEYEKYFTLRTAKLKFADLEQEVVIAQAALAEARVALDAVEEDSIAYELSAGEVRRLHTQLPQLRRKLAEYEQAWLAVDSLQEKVAGKLKELAVAETIEQTELLAHSRRRELIEQIDSNNHRLQAENQRQAPLRAQADQLKAQLVSGQQVSAELRRQFKSAQQTLERAEGDDRYVRDLETIDAENLRLKRLAQISTDMQSHLAIATAISVDDDALASFREADSQRAIALGMRDAAATTVSVSAHQELLVEFDADSVTLCEGAMETRTIAAELALRLPGVADIRIIPSQSAAKLQERTQDAEHALAALAARHGVTDLAAAVAAHQQRAVAQREIERLKSREEATLQQFKHEEIAAQVNSLQGQCERYLSQRGSGADIPANTTASQARVKDARLALARAQHKLDDAHERAQELQRKHEECDAELRLAQQELAVLQATLNEKRERLENERVLNPDAELAERARRATANVGALGHEAKALQTSLDAASPEAAQVLLANAKNVCERAMSDLQAAEQSLAVLRDRLQNAQADGRFEAFDSAQRRVENATVALQAVRQRSGSAALLWATLNKHRNAAREAYVRPLKEAIERLGAIVFGSGFQIAIADDWSIVSRTLHGKTLLFDDLSIGAKEQLGILARLAAAQIVSRQGGVPLIIDDALGFADPSRLETMGAAIAAAGKQCQIIILTCTPGRFTNVGNAQLVRL